MKSIIYTLFALANITICFTQTDSTEHKETMRKFDLEAYEKNRDGNRRYCRFTSTNNQGDSIEIYLEDYKDEYLESITFFNAPIKEIYKYSKKTMNLIYENEFFHGCYIGFNREYNEEGELVKEIDNDAPFKFTWRNLVEKMRECYDVELWNKRSPKYRPSVSVSRDEKALQYTIRLNTEFVVEGVVAGWKQETFIIDGTTGELLKHGGNDARNHPEKINKNERK